MNTELNAVEATKKTPLPRRLLRDQRGAVWSSTRCWPASSRSQRSERSVRSRQREHGRDDPGLDGLRNTDRGMKSARGHMMTTLPPAF